MEFLNKEKLIGLLNKNADIYKSIAPDKFGFKGVEIPGGLKAYYITLKEVFVNKKLKSIVPSCHSLIQLQIKLKIACLDDRGYSFANSEHQRAFRNVRLNFVDTYISLVKEELNKNGE